MKENKDASKRFDEWESLVNCNDCARYWDNSCDGATKPLSTQIAPSLPKRSMILSRYSIGRNVCLNRKAAVSPG